MEEYLSIAEFAERAKVSKQSIYQRLKKSDDIIHKYIKIKGDKKVIAASAVDIIYNKDFAAYEEIETDKEKFQEENEIIKLLRQQVEQQQREIDIKNKQIEDLNIQLKASSERETNYQTLLNQQQQLTAAEKQKVLLLEERTQRKGLFNIFKKKGKVKE
jgi:predicted DNA-binding protein YlxM (UPF0122 family)